MTKTKPWYAVRYILLIAAMAIGPVAIARAVTGICIGRRAKANRRLSCSMAMKQKTVSRLSSKYQRSSPTASKSIVMRLCRR